jgi:hypothetical protein
VLKEDGIIALLGKQTQERGPPHVGLQEVERVIPCGASSQLATKLNLQMSACQLTV